jgi:hypothetical protein
VDIKSEKDIGSALSKFDPEWQIPKEKFSDWHFMLLGSSGTPEQIHYQSP